MRQTIILLVEDDVALLEGMSDTLEMMGYKTIRACNGREGLDVLQQVHPDLIISDIMMPEMDGYAFHQAVSSNPASSTIPFIFLTAKSDQSDVRRGLRVGVDAYLTKPFDLEDLLLHVQNKLNRFATVRKQSLAQLEELQRQIVTMFSHELRTPLTYIQGYADLLAETDQPTSPADMQIFLHGLQNGAHRLNRLVESLLALIQLDTGVYAQEFQEFATIEPDLGRVIRLALADSKIQSIDKDAVVEIEIEEGVPPVKIIEEHFSTALCNLLTNAVKFTRKEGAHVTVRARRLGERVFIDVQDKGIGISSNDLPHIFERFRQIDRQTYEQAGIGVGLAIARGLIQVQDGDIEAQSRLGVGSTFSIWLPAVV